MTMSDFWKWYAEVERTAPTTEVGKVMTAAGYHIAHTGGGCLVWEKTIGDLYFWICDEGNDLGDTLTENYLVGAYRDVDDGGEALDSDTMPNLKQAIEWCDCRVECFPVGAVS